MDWLPALYGKILVPGAVMSELLVLQTQGNDLSELLHAEWLEIRNPQPSKLLTALKLELDLGEAEAIALAKEIGADLLIIDERLGRDVARREGLKITGVLGIVLEAKQSGLISTVRPILDELIQIARFRIDPKLRDEVIELAGE